MAFARGVLEAAYAEAIEAHAASCDECRQTLAAVGRALVDEDDEVLRRPRHASAGELNGRATSLEVRPGDVINETYLIERPIGRGGMGAVYEAAHLRLRRRYAIKLVAPELSGQTEALLRLRREAEITSSLEHPHIVEVTDFGYTRAGGMPFIVMPLLQGEPLSAYLAREGATDLRLAVTVALQTASGLAAAHQHGVIHRDLKPSNLFLCRTPGGEVFIKVLDFGVSRLLGGTSDLTRSAGVVGSPSYMSPEQARGERGSVDQRSDIFALGAIVYTLLCGRPPFQGTSTQAIIYRVIHEQPDRLPPWARLPRPLRRLILAALSKDPRRRPPSMCAFAGELWRVSREIDPGLDDLARLVDDPASASAARARRLAPPLTGRRGVSVALAALSCAALALAAMPLVRRALDPRPPAGIRPLPSSARDSARAARVEAPARPRGEGPPVVGPPESAARPPRMAKAGGLARRRERKTGYLTIQSRAASDQRHLWADVYLDGKLLGRTPLSNLRVSAGTHRIQLERNGYRSVSMTVDVIGGRHRRVSAPLDASL